MPPQDGDELARIFPECIICAAAGWEAPDRPMAVFLATLVRGGSVSAIVIDLCTNHRADVRTLCRALAAGEGTD